MQNGGASLHRDTIIIIKHTPTPRERQWQWREREGEEVGKRDRAMLGYLTRNQINIGWIRGWGWREGNGNRHKDSQPSVFLVSIFGIISSFCPAVEAAPVGAHAAAPVYYRRHRPDYWSPAAVASSIHERHRPRPYRSECVVAVGLFSGSVWSVPHPMDSRAAIVPPPAVVWNDRTRAAAPRSVPSVAPAGRGAGARSTAVGWSEVGSLYFWVLCNFYYNFHLNFDRGVWVV